MALSHYEQLWSTISAMAIGTMIDNTQAIEGYEVL
jgi:hypothetical protein